MALFEGVVDEYDAARPSYPPGLYDLLEPLAGLRVLEGGAGTGIATRQLLERGARVTPFDIGPDLLRRAASRTSGLQPVVADGGALPFPDGCADLVCFAQSWHWIDHERGAAEAARVLRDGGRWAGWWSQVRADGEPWYEAYADVIEARQLGVHRDQRDTDWGATVAASGLFDVHDRQSVPWVREVAVDDWMTDQASHSYTAALEPEPRAALLAELRAVLDEHVPTGHLEVPYETWLWIADRR